MSPGGGGGGGGGRGEPLCGQHREALKLFCTRDLQPLCVVCARARGHSVVPIEEAAEQYKAEILSCLRAGKEEREKYLESRKAEGRRSPYLVGAPIGSLNAPPLLF
ncbi:hypothetical protein AAES_30722 [Amazona aestiva]|uniref:B box-type domain-containing protein n=1 Tax=Amazona aestiva TaxID=12930 RepID=A0A0Q3Q3A3_AMAAE|nr:hypothetical protein AAES_30722 [Amazona aestiva]